MSREERLDAARQDRPAASTASTADIRPGPVLEIDVICSD